jgi:membrane protease subunit HflK
MPWNNQGGGSGGGGWQGGGGNRGPWGQGPSGGGQGGGGGGAGGPGPNIEDLIRQGQDRLKRFTPGGGGRLGVIVVLLIILVIWLASGFYRVDTSQQGVVLRFGEWVDTTDPGLNYHLPAPIETVLLPEVTRVQQLDVGFQRVGTVQRRDLKDESLMLTGDENIVDIDFTVIWRIADAGQFLFNIETPEQTLKAVAESVMREVIGRRPIQDVLTAQKLVIEQTVQAAIQQTLDEYGAGILISEVKLQTVDPPAEVIDAFRDVQAAKADRARKVNEAQGFANSIIPEARGQAAKILEEAQAYKEQKIAEAEGEASRYNAIVNEWRTSKEVTSRRLYLETMEEVMRDMNKIIIEEGEGGGSGVVPYLPLNELSNRKRGTN